MASSIANVINSHNQELLAAFETHRKNFKVSRDTRRKLKMCFHVFRMYILHLLKENHSRDDAYQLLLDQLSLFRSENAHFLDAVSWDRLQGALKQVVYEWNTHDPTERIKRSFLVELAADAPKVEEEDLEGDAADDASANEAQPDDVKAPKAYYEMELHDTTKMLIEGYYNQVVSKIKQSCTGDWWKQL